MTAMLTNVSMANMATGPWTDAENDLIFTDYFEMFAADLAGRPYNKAEHNRRLLEPIGNIPPAEAEERHYAMLEQSDMAA